MRRRTLGMALTVLVVAVGCSSGGGSDSDASLASVKGWARDARSAGYTEQYEELRDGSITTAEYEDAIERAEQCLRDAGYTASDPYVTPTDGLTLVYQPSPNGRAIATFNKESLACKRSQAALVEAAYVATHEPHFTEPLRQAMASCVGDAGVTLTGHEHNMKDFAAAAGKARRDTVVRCVTAEGQRLYPDKTLVIAL